MSIYVNDATAPNLFTGATLNAAGTTTSSAVEVDWPGMTLFELSTSAVSGSSPTLDVTIQGCETEDFATADVVTLGSFGQVGDEDNVTYQFRTDVRCKYIRASVTAGGTTPVYTGSTLYAKPLRNHWEKLDTAAALA